MRAILMSLSFLFSVSAFAGEVVSTLIGDAALTHIQILHSLSANRDDIESYTSKLQRGIGGDNVIEEIEQISGTIGRKMFECESHTFQKYEAAPENESEYVDSATCYIK